MTTVTKTTIFRQNLLGNNYASNDGLLFQELFYDDNGIEIERVNYDPRGKVEERVKTKVINGLIAEEELEIEGEITERVVKSYDDKGRLTSETKYYSEGGHDVTSYHHDGEHLILRQVIDSDGEEGEKQTWEYDGGKVLKEKSYNIFGNLDTEKSYTYGDDGELAEVVEIFHDDDNSEKLVSIIENGRTVLEKKYNAKGKLVARNTITYNDNGKAIMIQEETQRGTKTTKFEYDEAGNNVTQDEFEENDEVARHIERTFDTEGRVLSIEVMVQPDGYNPGQHYILTYNHE